MSLPAVWCCGVRVVCVCQVQRSRILVLLAWPAFRLQCACSGPVHAVRSSACPRSHVSPGVIVLPHLGQVAVCRRPGSAPRRNIEPCALRHIRVVLLFFAGVRGLVGGLGSSIVYFGRTASSFAMHICCTACRPPSPLPMGGRRRYRLPASCRCLQTVCHIYLLQ